MALLNLCNLCMKFKNFWAKSILLKHYENGNKKKISQLVPGSAKSRIYAGKSTKREFSKKAIARIEIFCCFRFLSKAWNAKLDASFLLSKILYKECGLLTLS